MRARTRWDIVFCDLTDGNAGETDFDTNTIRLQRGMLQAERRCTVAHEGFHADRGPVCDDPVLIAREEAAIDQDVARHLIGIRELGEALAWSRDLDEVAEELWVDRHTLDVRLAHLHPAEGHYLRRRLGDEVG